MSSGFYGYRFRLAFLPEMDVETLVQDYKNLPYINSTKSAPPVSLGPPIRRAGGSKHAAVRIPTKVVFGTLFCVPFTAIGTNLYNTYFYDEPEEYEDNPWGGWDSFFYGLVVGGAVGFPVGVTLVDPDDSLPGPC